MPFFPDELWGLILLRLALDGQFDTINAFSRVSRLMYAVFGQQLEAIAKRWVENWFQRTILDPQIFGSHESFDYLSILNPDENSWVEVVKEIQAEEAEAISLDNNELKDSIIMAVRWRQNLRFLVSSAIFLMNPDSQNCGTSNGFAIPGKGISLLFLAAEVGNLPAVIAITSMEVTQKKLCTALNFAISNHHPDVGIFLLKKITSKDLIHHLIDAAEYGFAEIVEIICQKAVDVNALHLQRTAIQAACRGKQVACVQLLLKYGAYIQQPRSVLPLAIVLADNHDELLELILASGQDLGVVDSNNRSFIFYALTLGANIDKTMAVVKRINAIRPRHQYLSLNERDLYQDSIPMSLLRRHYKYKYPIDNFFLLIDKYQVDLTALNAKNKSALYFACGTTSNEVIRPILERAPEMLNIPSRSGKTCLIRAIKRNRNPEPLARVKLLVEAGADINACDRTGKNALDYCNDEETMMYLFSHPICERWRLDNDHNSYLKQALSRAWYHFARLFLQQCPYPKVALFQKNRLGKAPIHTLTTVRSLQLVKDFVDLGSIFEEHLKNEFVSGLVPLMEMGMAPLLSKPEYLALIPFKSIYIIEFLESQGVDITSIPNLLERMIQNISPESVSAFYYAISKGVRPTDVVRFCHYLMLNFSGFLGLHLHQLGYLLVGPGSEQMLAVIANLEPSDNRTLLLSWAKLTAAKLSFEQDYVGFFGDRELPALELRLASAMNSDVTDWFFALITAHNIDLGIISEEARVPLYIFEDKLRFNTFIRTDVFKAWVLRMDTAWQPKARLLLASHYDACGEAVFAQQLRAEAMLSSVPDQLAYGH